MAEAYYKGLESLAGVAFANALKNMDKDSRVIGTLRSHLFITEDLELKLSDFGRELFDLCMKRDIPTGHISELFDCDMNVEIYHWREDNRRTGSKDGK